jgi:O-methyltransferase
MSKINRKGKTYLFDSFSGFKKDDGLHKKDVFFYDDIRFVKKNIKRLNLKSTNVFKAFFPNDIKVKIRKIKLCHIDVNTFSDTKNIFYWIEKRMIKGGIIIFDDYGIWGVDGIKKFIYMIEKKYNKRYYFIKNYMGQCILIKK